MLNRQEASDFVKEKVKNKNLIKHMLALEVVMKALARKYNENEEQWGLAGLLHDADCEEVEGMERQGVLVGEWLGDKIDETIQHACAAHNSATGAKREKLIDHAIYAADPLTGLIVASTLVLPSKKLADLSAESIVKRYNEPRFAAGADREAIISCEDGNGLNLSLNEFAQIGLSAMQEISNDIDL